LDGVDFGPFLANPTGLPAPRAFAPSANFRYGAIRGRSRASATEFHSAWRAIREQNWKYVQIEGGASLLFDLASDPGELINLATRPEHGERCEQMTEGLLEGFNWEDVRPQLASDLRRLPEFASGAKPTTPNQYMLADGRIFDAEGDLYAARWLHIPSLPDISIIPQQFG
jgi:hypothetical protein